MAFFSKKSGGNKTSAAGELFRSKNTGKFGDENALFQKRLDAKVEKDLADYTRAKRISSVARGEKNAPEISENAKKMLTILAHKKVQKEIKKEKQDAQAAVEAAKAAKRAVETTKRNVQYQADLKARELEEAQKQSGRNYFFGYTEE